MSISNKEEVDFIFKILLLGDSSVGKTCFLKRFIDGTFQEVYMSTISLDYKIKLINVDDLKIKIQLWDIPVQNRFMSITKNYFKGTNGIILIYDVTNRNTFENIKTWMEQIEESKTEDLIIYLVGNKIDEEENRKIKEEEGKETGTKYKLRFFEASAKNNKGIEELFIELVKEIINKRNNEKNEEENNEEDESKEEIKDVNEELIENKEKKKKKCCCCC